MRPLARGTVLLAICGLGVGLGTVWASGQAGSDQARKEEERSVRRLEVLGGRGSEIGATVRDADESDLKREKWATPAGVVVEEVRRDSPAARAGLRAGDLIVEFDGERVRSARQFARLVQETPPGRTVKGIAVRGGQKVAFEVTPEAGSGPAILGYRGYGEALAERLGQLRADLARSGVGDFEIEVRMRPGRLGVSVVGLTAQLAAYFGVKDGVLVTSVEADSPAARAGVKAGDVITALDGTPIRDADDLRRRVARLESGAEFALAVVRDRKELVLKGKLEDRGARGRSIVRVPVD
jgi:serine protease Do